MKILVTGGSGFLGKHLLEKLIFEGHLVYALARTPKSAKVLYSLGAVPVEGSLENISDWTHALEGIDIVIHCASPVEYWGPQDYFYRQITIPTRDLLFAANSKDVKKFIYISTDAVLYNSTSLLDIDSSHPLPPRPHSYYAYSKMLAEQIILDYDGQIESIILRPPYIWGLGDKLPKQIAARILAGKVMWIDQGRTEIETVHVQNLAYAILLAMANGRDKGIYFITDQSPITVKECFTRILNANGVAPPNRSIPGWLAIRAATFLEILWTVFKLPSAPPLSLFEYTFLNCPRRYSRRLTEKDLGYRPIISREQGYEEIAATTSVGSTEGAK